MESQDYYNILQVPQDCDLPKIKTAYKKSSLAVHPDKNPSDVNATANFQRLLEAYQVLSNPTKRQQYDLQLTQLTRLSTPSVPKTPKAPTTQSAPTAQSPSSVPGPRPAYDEGCRCPYHTGTIKVESSYKPYKSNAHVYIGIPKTAYPATPPAEVWRATLPAYLYRETWTEETLSWHYETKSRHKSKTKGTDVSQNRPKALEINNNWTVQGKKKKPTKKRNKKNKNATTEPESTTQDQQVGNLASRTVTDHNNDNLKQIHQPDCPTSKWEEGPEEEVEDSPEVRRQKKEQGLADFNRLKMARANKRLGRRGVPKKIGKKGGEI